MQRKQMMSNSDEEGGADERESKVDERREEK